MYCGFAVTSLSPWNKFPIPCSSPFATLHGTAWDTELHCTPLSYVSYTALHSIALHCTALNSKAHWNRTLHCNVDATLHISHWTLQSYEHTAQCTVHGASQYWIDATILHNIGTLQGVHYKQCHTSIYANALHNEVALTQLVFCHSYTVFCANKDHFEMLYITSTRHTKIIF